MRIEPCSVNTFFNENCRNVTVWLACEQADGLFGKDPRLNVYISLFNAKETGPAGPVAITETYL
ncbi:MULTISPECIES: hypothetical protein [unclassified Enterobacter]|uniref:hypothetical protein n=1 Tax=unclassified Enterobacter TaxID=2608935 RepID=UPI0011CDD9FA|nr:MULTISPECIES: hypothetical protein [unclassified Enterobacter]